MLRSIADKLQSFDDNYPSRRICMFDAGAYYVIELLPEEIVIDGGICTGFFYVLYDPERKLRFF